MEKRFHCEIVSWSQVRRLARRLAWVIREAGYRPQVIVAIARGGYVPARLLCDFLGVYELSSLRVAHYTAGAHKERRARLAEPLRHDIAGRDVLLVDDVGDTGDTLALALAHLRAAGAAQVKSAVLHHKKTSSVVPDFHARRVIRWRWIIYPWAVIEDLGGFIARMEHRPPDPATAARRLADEYGIRVSPGLMTDVYAWMRR